jgi:protein TonB
LKVPAQANPSQGFVGRKRPADPAALLFSLLLTAALFGLMLLVSGIADRARPMAERLAVFSVMEISTDDRPPPKEQPVDQREVFADSPEEASPSSSPVAAAPAPELPDIPDPEHHLSATDVPATVDPDEGRTVAGEADSQGNQAQGPVGPGGQGGNGMAGNGSGGAGRGNGTGSRLTASWAPDMDFSVLDRFYPKQARLAKIEGTVWMSCFVLRLDRVKDCKLIGETPEGQGFGRAAMRARSDFRVRVHNQAGRRIYNEWVTIRSHFRVTYVEGENPADPAESQP